MALTFDATMALYAQMQRETDMTIQQIIDGCRMGGISLEQRLAAVGFSSIPHQQQEEKLIKEYLERRKGA